MVGTRICVIGAGPCGLAAVKNLLQAGLRDVVCYDESDSIGGNWAYTEDPSRPSVHDRTHTISSRRASSFDDFPMPDHYPDFPSHRQVLAYLSEYATAFRLEPHIRLGSRVERCVLGDDGRWTVRVVAGGAARSETFDSVLVCSGHHREPSLPALPGTFTGDVVHSSAYKRAEPYHGRRVLVVGAGNSAADIAVDVARVAAHTALSMREGAYFIPKLMFGKPVDVVYSRWRRALPMPLLRSALRLWLRLTVGRWAEYGLPTPTHKPLQKPPTVNSGVFDALRHGLLAAHPGVERCDGHTVHFTDGTRERFDTIIMATGFRIAFPFLPRHLVDWDPAEPAPLYLKMMHPTVPTLFFIGLFQPIGCIWRLADHQARIAALQISGRRSRPDDIDARIRREVMDAGNRFGPSPITVDYHAFRRRLLGEAGGAPVAKSARCRSGCSDRSRSARTTASSPTCRAPGCAGC
jgi:cation diffusion facilitator CzcD-associated flavoprotein CzcO